nr:NADP-dependent oxidoreductase [Kibdelosporangium sp. MJ126-NF4]CEL23035.1 Putative oxidoreductase YncB [Kibdelosporangium sp. MJ126-NF4]CTQ90174.1 Putative oxidoreductase YncB [Kibdelosporangium sp. MJ126-NF4]
MTSTLTAVRQVRRPRGEPRRDDFTFVTRPLPRPADGQVLVENLYLSVDPYMRELMDLDPGEWELGAGLEGRTIGRVVESREPGLPVGAVVFHRHGWSTHALLAAADARQIMQPEGVPLRAFLGILGGTGLTAYVGLTRIARLRPGDDVFVSAAAGAVGSAAGQIARLLGAGRIVGSTGSAAKAARLKRFGYDTGFDHHSGPVAQLLANAAPDGIDVYFDNVGGEHLAAAIGSLRHRGRVAWCGAVAQYNSLGSPPTAPRNLFDVVEKSLRIEGFLVRDYRNVREEFEQFMVPYVRSGQVGVAETVTDGFENVVDAFIGMLRGENVGKALVRVSPVAFGGAIGQ